MKHSVDTFICLTFKINDRIRCLPNFDTQHNTIQLIKNNSGLLFVYIHNHLLVIPGHLLVYFMEYPILNYRLSNINKTNILRKDIIDQFKEIPLFKIFLSNIKITNFYEYYLYSIIIKDQNTKKIMFNYIYGPEYTYKSEFNKKIDENFDGFQVKKYNASDYLILPEYRLKALKYKNKYLKLLSLYKL